MGGANSGDVNFPEHMLKQHRRWIYGGEGTSPTYESNVNIAQAIDLASTWGESGLPGSNPGASPFFNVNAFDPDGDVTAMQSRVDAWIAFLTALANDDPLDHTTDALAKVDSELLPTTYVDDLVDSYEAKTETRHLRSVSRVAAGFFDQRAIQITNFGQELAFLEVERNTELGDFEKKMRAQVIQVRLEACLRLSQMMQMQQQLRAQQYQATTIAQFDVSKVRIAAKQDETAINLDFEMKDALWDLELFKYGNATMSAISGAATIPTPTRIDKFFGYATQAMGLAGQSMGMGMNMGGMALQGLALL